MTTDVVVSRELTSLQDELAATQQERSAAPVAAPTKSPSSTRSADDTADEIEMRDQLAQFVNEVTGFMDDAEATIATHPAQSVVGALLVGILIGRLLGRR